MPRVKLFPFPNDKIRALDLDGTMDADSLRLIEDVLNGMSAAEREALLAAFDSVPP